MVSFLGSVILLALAFGFSKSGLAKNFSELTQKLHASGTINCPQKKKNYNEESTFIIHSIYQKIIFFIHFLISFSLYMTMSI